jgi:hypothetical protein
VGTSIGVTISSHSITICRYSEQQDFGAKKMQKTKKPADRERAQYAELHGQYRSIGPAAILAALLHTKKRNAPLGKAA